MKNQFSGNSTLKFSPLTEQDHLSLSKLLPTTHKPLSKENFNAHVDQNYLKQEYYYNYRLCLSCQLNQFYVRNLDFQLDCFITIMNISATQTSPFQAFPNLRLGTSTTRGHLNSFQSSEKFMKIPKSGPSASVKFPDEESKEG